MVVAAKVEALRVVVEKAEAAKGKGGLAAAVWAAAEKVAARLGGWLEGGARASGVVVRASGVAERALEAAATALVAEVTVSVEAEKAVVVADMVAAEKAVVAMAEAAKGEEAMVVVG